jgi:hypothetical protein
LLGDRRFLRRFAACRKDDSRTKCLKVGPQQGPSEFVGPKDKRPIGSADRNAPLKSGKPHSFFCLRRLLNWSNLRGQKVEVQNRPNNDTQNEN